MSIRVILVTPYKSYFEGHAESVIVPLYDGLAGILKKHVGMIAQLGSGKLVINTNEEKNIFFIDGGFLEVSKNQVSILANEAFKKEDLNYKEIEAQYKNILKQVIHNDDQIDHKIQQLDTIRKKLSFIKT